MDTVLLSIDAPGVILRALEILDGGGLIAFPTDTVYGVGARAFNETAIARIYTVKERPSSKAIPILCGDIEDVPRVTSGIPRMARKLAVKFWPGPLTLVLSKHAILPKVVAATGTVAVRIPDHPFVRKLLKEAGPMAVTSANVSNQPSPRSAQEVIAQLGGRIELVMDGGTTKGLSPSTIVDCTGEEPLILRAGPITLDEILNALHN